MGRLIDADALLERWKYKFDHSKSLEECIKTQPTVERFAWIQCSVELPPLPKENVLFDNKPLELYLVTELGVYYPFRAFWNGKYFTDIQDNDLGHLVIDEIKRIPTAYCMDKVVEEIKGAEKYVTINGIATDLKALHPL